MESHIEHLQQLKAYDKHLAYEKEARAQEMQERKRVEVSLTLMIYFFSSYSFKDFNVCFRGNN